MDALLYILEILYHGFALIGAFVVFSMICTLIVDWRRSRSSRKEITYDKQ